MNYIECDFVYGWTPFSTILCSIGLVILAILIEFAAHGWRYPSQECSCTPAAVTTEALANSVQNIATFEEEGRAPAEATTSRESEGNESKRQTPPSLFGKHPHPPSASLRAIRLATATLLIFPICVLFGLRIHEMNAKVPWECRNLGIGYTNWTAVLLFSIGPLISGSLAWLRTVVDCVLFSFGRGLEERGIRWPPVFPFFFITVPLVLAYQLIKSGAMWIMERKVREAQKAAEAKEDVAVNEEEVGLLPRGADFDDDEATMFTPSPRGSYEGRGSSVDRKALPPLPHDGKALPSLPTYQQ